MIVVDAEWGRSACLPESGSFAELAVQMPDAPHPGEHSVDGLPVQYRRGGQVLTYDTRSAEGSIRVDAVSPHAVDVTFDLSARRPSTDRHHLGTIPLTGGLRLRRGIGAATRPP